MLCSHISNYRSVRISYSLSCCSFFGQRARCVSFVSKWGKQERAARYNHLGSIYASAGLCLPCVRVRRQSLCTNHPDKAWPESYSCALNASREVISDDERARAPHGYFITHTYTKSSQSWSTYHLSRSHSLDRLHTHSKIIIIIQQQQAQRRALCSSFLIYWAWPGVCRIK